MEAACRRTSKSLRFRPLCIPHAVTVIVMVIAFHTEGPDKVRDAHKILLFPDLFPSAGSKEALLTQKWDAILGNRTLTSFADTSMLMGKQKVAPIAGWDEAASQIEAWALFCTIFLGDDGGLPATCEMFLLL